MLKRFRILRFVAGVTVAFYAFGLALMITGCDGIGAFGGKTYKVGVCVGTFDDCFYTLVRQEIDRYFKSLETDRIKYEVFIDNGKGDQSEQRQQVNEFIKQKVDVMIVNLVEASAADTVTQKAKAAGIPVVYNNREPSGEDMQAWDKICYVGADPRQSGIYQGEIIRDLPDRGDADGDGVVRYVMIIGDSKNTDAQYRTEFSITALTDAGVQVEELLSKIGNWDQTKGRIIAAEALEQFGDKVDVIFCNNDGMAMGAIMAIKEAGRTVGKDIYLVGADAIPEATDAIKAGDMTGTVKYDDKILAHTIVDAAVKYINRKDVDTYVWVDYVKITAKN